MKGWYGMTNLLKTMEVNVGPQHPSTHGVLRLVLELDGEIIKSCKPVVGYLHRGIEKMAESRSYLQYLPVVDRIDADGVVTSVKSRDLTSSTYQNASRLEYQIKKDVDTLDSFSGRTWNGIEISSSDITGKQLQIVVPETEISEGQIQAINYATEYANEKGIDIIITVGKEVE